MDNTNRPYMQSEVAAFFAAKGVKFTSAYINVVIHSKTRSTPHPLAAAHLCKGMWDRETVNAWLKSQAPEGNNAQT